VAHGKCYVVDQEQLVFGSDRGTPLPWRPAVSLARRGGCLVVLPSTTAPNNAFYPLAADACLTKTARSSADQRTSYLCPRYEAVPSAAVREAGILDQTQRVRIGQWVSRYWEGGE
jgi:hypothetical protein